MYLFFLFAFIYVQQFREYIKIKQEKIFSSKVKLQIFDRTCGVIFQLFVLFTFSYIVSEHSIY